MPCSNVSWTCATVSRSSRSSTMSCGDGAGICLRGVSPNPSLFCSSGDSAAWPAWLRNLGVAGHSSENTSMSVAWPGAMRCGGLSGGAGIVASVGEELVFTLRRSCTSLARMGIGARCGFHSLMLPDATAIVAAVPRSSLVSSNSQLKAI